jgi:aminoglycoside 6'-N-acetyltransferase I
MQVVLRPTNFDDRDIIKNLFVFYRYDLMPFLNGHAGGTVNRLGIIGSDDQVSHEQSVIDINIWWTKPDILMPMLICADNAPAGFVMVATPPYARPPANYLIEEFFIVNRYRRSGVGLSAATELFRRYAGVWELGWLPENVGAEHFWKTVISRLGLHAENWQIAGEADSPALAGLRFDTK